MKDLFDAPASPRNPAPAPEKVPDAPPEKAKPALPCVKPWDGVNHKCRVGGGDAPFSDNGGLSWFCKWHAPPRFFPGDR